MTRLQRKFNIAYVALREIAAPTSALLTDEQREDLNPGKRNHRLFMKIRAIAEDALYRIDGVDRGE